MVHSVPNFVLFVWRLAGFRLSVLNHGGMVGRVWRSPLPPVRAAAGWQKQEHRISNPMRHPLQATNDGASRFFVRSHGTLTGHSQKKGPISARFPTSSGQKGPPPPGQTGLSSRHKKARAPASPHGALSPEFCIFVWRLAGVQKTMPGSSSSTATAGNGSPDGALATKIA